MPNQLKPLTNVEIAGAKPVAQTMSYGTVKACTCWLRLQGGRPAFRVLSSRHQKRTKTSLGPYPVVTLAMARETRTKYRRLLYQGIDPRQHLAGIAEEKRIQNECTLEKVAEQWLKEKKRTSDLSEDHAKDVWRSLEMHVFPSLGNTPVTEIRPKMLRNTSPRWKNRASSKRCGESSHGLMKSSVLPSPKSSSNSIRLTTWSPASRNQKQNMPPFTPVNWAG